MKKQRVRFDCALCEEEVTAYVHPGALVSCPECRAVYIVGLDGDTYSIKANEKKDNSPLTSDESK